ncbi:toll-like receptor 5 [Mercenaria mercenaria]|uniref:toll-like receptor 5 n=1 Tax=Mercenaria mercenaria TaxID=6596 RepID=UPI00234EFDE6|nr:toll-like receptor 5 [Mercenaria mercenaria]XP_045173910.2 toll-like receptor 5 [Mercenaria mercenaria]XP_045173916.2 toll-like receptor 5 [Mercenaria mercenaria]XP_045173925.2 toll-like receptor 5 [Mercenaria mercenaria]XP_053406105.1 toll-like receptor 5 [Mercenaria mercenaria]
MASKCIVVFLIGINVSVSVAYNWCKDFKNQILKCNYFPKDIPYGISEVHIEHFMDPFDNVVVNSSTFQSENWSHLKRLKLRDNLNDDTKTLKFEAKSFIGLEKVQEFHLHVQSIIYLDSDSLVGLNNLKTLDFGACGRLSLKQVNSAISGSANLKSLEIVNISRLDYHVQALDIDMNFFYPLRNTNIKYLDISHTDISMLRLYTLQYLRTLETFNLSSSSIADMTLYPDKQAENYTLLRNVKMLDISFYPLTKLAAFVPNTITNFDFLTWDLPDALYIVRQFLSCQTINVTGILTISKKTVKLKNCIVKITGRIPWLVREIFARQNNLNRLDAKFHCGNYTVYTIKHFDIAENNLEFLHPSIVSCMPNIEILDLSNNLMYRMVAENVSLFEKLFISLRHLKSITLSANKLRYIPRKLFENNLELLSVDFSVNFISQVTFSVDKLNHLKVLDLRSNIIKILDKESMTMLDLIHMEQNKTMPVVNLNNNPICCSKCEAESFLEWLTKTNIVDKTNLKCVDENSVYIDVTDNILRMVRNICQRRKLVIYLLASGVTLAFMVISIYKRKKQILKKMIREKVLRRLQDGKGQFQFAAFLYFCSKVEDFVQNLIESKLDEKLKEMIEITDSGRKLVFSEKHFWPGRSLPRQFSDYSRSSSVLLVVLCEAYCTCSYCNDFLEIIIMQKRNPIMLLMKQQIDERHMAGLIKHIYEKAAVRIQWESGYEEHILSTTLDQMCSSIVDIIVANLGILSIEYDEQQVLSNG